jgi:hypothetical protein
LQKMCNVMWQVSPWWVVLTLNWAIEIFLT